MAKQGGIKPIYVGVVVVAALIFFGRSGSKAESRSVTINGTKLGVEIVRSDQEKTRGLGGKDSLDENEGMLFVYDNPEQPVFWMKGMRFPIDIIWIKDGKVVDIDESLASPGDYYLENSLPKYKPSEPVDRVLEVNSGWIKEHRVKRGDVVQYNF